MPETTIETHKPLVPPAPGIYPDVNAAIYHKWDCVSASRLKLMRQCPAKCRYALDHPEEMDTEAMALGRAYHDAILLPHDFERDWIKAGACEARLKSGDRKGDPCGLSATLRSPEGSWYCGKHADSECLPPENALCGDDYDLALSIRKKVHAHPEAEDLLFGKGLNEASIVWRDGETGLTCRGRIDRYCWSHRKIGDRRIPVPTHVDIKGTVDASPEGFSREIHKHGYHIQAALYLDGCNALKPSEFRRFVFIAVEKKPPYCVGVYELGDSSIDQGRREYRRLMTRYANCLETGNWPDYTNEGVGYIDVPSWALDKEI